MRVLFVCTANLDRSPTAEAVARELFPGTHETRSAGTSPSAVRPLGDEDMAWAELVVVMEERHRAVITARWPEAAGRIRVLGIEDRYHRGDPALHYRLERALADLLADVGMV